MPCNSKGADSGGNRMFNVVWVHITSIDAVIPEQILHSYDNTMSCIPGCVGTEFIQTRNPILASQREMCH